MVINSNLTIVIWSGSVIMLWICLGANAVNDGIQKLEDVEGLATLHNGVKGPMARDIPQGKQRNGRKHAGRNVYFGEYRYVAAVYHAQYAFPKCAGIILNDWSVLTSCSCILEEEEHRLYAFPSTPKTLHVIAGNPNADSSFHESRTVIRVTVHPLCEMKWVGTRADLAVLKVNKSFQTRNYKHVSIAPRYVDRTLNSMISRLTTFQDDGLVCEVVTFGYYTLDENDFLPSHTMRAFRLTFVKPFDYCAASCPNLTLCVFDFYARTDACFIGAHVGPCGILPGSPVICDNEFWGIYTGRRNCTINGGVAIPMLPSFLAFFEAQANTGEAFIECGYLDDFIIVVLTILTIIY